MGAPSVGDVVIIPVPYSDLSKSKRRPALVLAEVGRGDFLLCQITSKQYGDLHALALKESDFLSVGIKRGSFIRGTQLFTANEALILGVAGHLTHTKLSEVVSQLIDILSACLKDDTF
ncbi:type II toxin-antitoxin system PemK/MazF family toxin [Synechococcus sp. CCAP 1479/9]|uniref:type II toxin-antitoxin system PemK/MazF family toxin n=1 Tax=Synechococcus sp. CCAP 1479/9 TaxID=1221593 RepID=UPI001C21800F|nr:type II toxin-antitoxin system PemK/MazF family toxin [Synechococcus sp. CCAP 1479/9]